MGSNWLEYKLADLCDSIDYGFTTSAKDEPVGPKLLRITDIVSGHIDWDNVPYCESDQTNTEKYILHDKDIVIARTGASTGRSMFISNPPKAVFASYLVRLQVSDKAHSRFVSYFLKSSSFWDYMRGVLGDKSAQPNASAKTMTQIKLKLPPLSEQRAIAQILCSLDDKIELNRRMNKTLEAMARAIFKSWFVDFDPVRAKAEGRPTGLPDYVAELFPDSFEDSEMGEIPKGWKLRSLYDSAKYINGAAYRNFHFKDEEGALPVVKIAELKSGVTDQTKFTKTELEAKYKISDGEILLSWSGNPDTSIGTFVWCGGPAWLNQHIFRVLPHQDIDKHFVFYLLKYLRPVFAEIARDKQTTGLGHFTSRDMKQLMVVHPPDNILTIFNDYVGPMFDRWYANLFESNTLISLRDTLLPKLVSGELRVPDAEKFALEADL